jgi:hypothetical protein
VYLSTPVNDLSFSISSRDALIRRTAAVGSLGTSRRDSVEISSKIGILPKVLLWYGPLMSWMNSIQHDIVQEIVWYGRC